ncbi:hypothetical protein RUND412_010572 [Rhizina undulata]
MKGTLVKPSFKDLLTIAASLLPEGRFAATVWVLYKVNLMMRKMTLEDRDDKIPITDNAPFRHGPKRVAASMKMSDKPPVSFTPHCSQIRQLTKPCGKSKSLVWKPRFIELFPKEEDVAPQPKQRELMESQSSPSPAAKLDVPNFSQISKSCTAFLHGPSSGREPDEETEYEAEKIVSLKLVGGAPSKKRMYKVHFLGRGWTRARIV